MVTTGTVCWSDQNATRTEDLVFPPLELARNSAAFLVHGLLRGFGLLEPLDKLVDKAAAKFPMVQFHCVSDAAAANCKALPQLFSWLQARSSNCVATHSPCLLHQMSRIVVLNLEHQAVVSLLVAHRGSTLFKSFVL